MNNPFSIDRAEHLGDELYKFYTSNKTLDNILRRKSILLTGGRGTGKTMFFMYHSYWQQKKEAVSTHKEYDQYLKETNYICAYIRADSTFVTGFQFKSISQENWENIFSHYLNLIISKKLLEIIQDINNCSSINIIYEGHALCKKINHLLDKAFASFQEVYEYIDLEEVSLLKFINNVANEKCPRLIPNNLLINLISEIILSHQLLTNKTVHVFVDEYENFLEYQQIIINTFVKHPNPTIFDLGMRQEGMKSYNTKSENESIRYPDDFDKINFEDISDEDYRKFVSEISRKRIKKNFDDLGLSWTEEYYNIEFYLGDYDYNDELRFIDNEKSEKIKQDIKLELQGFKDQTQISILYETDDIFLLRLNLVLLERKEPPSLLATELKNHLNGIDSKYKDWIHNNRHGIIFLLVKEFNRRKEYYGLNTFISLSSGVIRYFLELCEAAFRNAFYEGFSFEKPRSLTAKEQTDAAYYVSKYKIEDIDTYSKQSSRIKRFLLLIGKIFESLHRDKKLSEPERNHFGTDFDKLKDESKALIKDAIMYSVLLKRDETKDKDSKIDLNHSEFHINHIYAPFFQISARKIRKLNISHKDLDLMLLEAPETAERIANKYKSLASDDSKQLDLFK